jgi:hypothetical protein
MQLSRPIRPAPVRGRIAAAAFALAAGVPVAAVAQTATPAPPAADLRWQFEATGLLFGEQGRTRIAEPIARITRLFAGGQTLSAQLGIDVMSGASPTGAMPSGRVQTTTTPSGNLQTVQPGTVVTSPFQDTRGSLDLEWVQPSFGARLVTTATGHVSRETDYQSLGASGKVALDVMNRLTTLTVGGGYNRDSVFPVGGIPVPFDSLRPASDDEHAGPAATGPSLGADRAKDVASGLVGVARVVTRRWLVGVNASRTTERGYLTEPYKVVSLIDPATGFTAGQFNEHRPDTRERTAVLASSVYHFTANVLYVSYRYYWDDWGVHSHTVDGSYRVELTEGAFVEPHLRLYTQGAADFFHYGVTQGEPLPEFATSDMRLARMNTFTLGLTYGFRPHVVPGELTVRAEYLRQKGDGHPAGAIGVQKTLDLLPPVNMGTGVVTWSVRF